jgi:O-acetylserine/cysteine efflux transporter
VVQTQVFFTLLLAVRIRREKVLGTQWLGLALAAGGVAVIASHTDGTTTPLGLAMILAAAFCWACANLLTQRAGRIDMLAYVVWSSAFAVPPLLLLALLIDGPQQMAAGVAASGLGTWAAVLWQSLGNTLFGYGVWSWLLARHPAGRIVPMALLVPVFGMGSASLLLGEPLPAWKLIAAALVLAGLAINLFGARLLQRWPAVARD